MDILIAIFNGLVVIVYIVGVIMIGFVMPAIFGAIVLSNFEINKRISFSLYLPMVWIIGIFCLFGAGYILYWLGISAVTLGFVP